MPSTRTRELDAEYARLRQTGAAGWGDGAHATRAEGWRDALAQLAQLGVLPRPPADMLELGCGNGTASLVTAMQGYSMSGIDLSRNAILWARERFRAAQIDASLVVGDVAALPFGEGRFDCVVDGNCLHFLFGRERAACLNEARRVLRKNGALLVSSMCGSLKATGGDLTQDLRIGRLYRRGRPHRTLRPSRAVAAKIEDAGFEIVHARIKDGVNWDHLWLVAKPCEMERQ